jgi:outer membrane receptor protein involved in Fe transport
MLSLARWLPPCIAATGLGAEPPPALRGLSLEAAITEIEASGLTVYYSSDLIKRGMRVRAEPPSGTVREMLQAILAPFDLAIQPGPGESVLIVRQTRPPASRPDSSPPPAVASPPNPGRPPIDELVVAASRYDLVRAVGASDVRLTSTDIEGAPDIGDDALRATHRLPGTATNPFSARANLRGGETGETLVLFDRLRLYDPYHLEDFQGVFSAVGPHVVSSMDVYTGGFPAMFGDRMSGVVDVASVPADGEPYSEIAVSFFNASVLGSGRFADGEGHWLATARRSNLDWLYRAFSARPDRPQYLDAFARLSYSLSDELAVTVNVLYFRDDVSLVDDVDVEEQAVADHEDRYLWARVDHTLRAGLTGSTLISQTTLAGDRTGFSEEEGVTRGRLEDHRLFSIDALQSDWSWSAADDLQVRFGTALARAHGSYDYRDEAEFAVSFDAPGAPSYTARTRDIRASPQGSFYSLYGSARYSPRERVTADLGLRWDQQTLDPGHSASLTPRLGVRYRVAGSTHLKASWGKFFQSQAISELQVQDGVTAYFEPQESEQAVIGIEHELARGIALRIEAYDKEMRRLRPRYENLLNTRTLLPELQPDRLMIAPDGAHSRGVELSVVQRVRPGLSWRASYSRATTEDRFGPDDVPRSWDQTDAFGAGVDWELAGWNVALAVAERSGWPTTAVELDVSGPQPIVRTGPRNAERVTRYRSVDFRIARNLQLRSSSLSVFAEVSNLFNHVNRCCTEYQIEDEAGEPVLELTPLDYPPLVPSLGFVWRF